MKTNKKQKLPLAIRILLWIIAIPPILVILVVVYIYVTADHNPVSGWDSPENREAYSRVYDTLSAAVITFSMWRQNARKPRTY